MNPNIHRAVTAMPFSTQICQGCTFDHKKENPYWYTTQVLLGSVLSGGTIVEETLTSNEYILMFLILILNMYI